MCEFCKTDEEIVRSFMDGYPVCHCGAVMVQDFETELWICPNCDFEVEDADEYESTGPYAELFQDISLLNSYNEYYDDEEYDEPGPGCEACGNPAYPDCKTSCPLFDD